MSNLHSHRSSNLRYPHPSSFSPKNWKKYLQMQEKDSQSNLRLMQTNQSSNRPPTEPNNQSSATRSARSASYLVNDSNVTQGSAQDPREEQERKKQEILRRVKSIQNKVMPILKSHDRNEEDEDVNWNNRVQQRILKLETALDSLDKEMEIKIQKRLIEVERQWENKFEELVNKAETAISNRTESEQLTESNQQ